MSVQSKPHNISISPDIGVTPDIESSTDQYAQRFSGAAGNWLLNTQVSVTREHLLALKADTILDVGGGHAQNIELVEGLGIRTTVTGSDISCRKRVDRISQSDGTNFVLGSLLQLPFADRAFPTVISYRIISHMSDWRAFIDELTRVSSEAVILDFAAQRSVNWFSEFAYRLKRGKEGDTRRFNVLSENKVDAAFFKNNFVRTKRTPQFFLPMAIHRALNSPRLSSWLEAISRCFGLSYLFGSPIISTYKKRS